VIVSVAVGSQGMGISLAEEEGRAVVRGFRTLANGVLNPAQQAGVQLGDVIMSVNGMDVTSFQQTIGLLKKPAKVCRISELVD